LILAEADEETLICARSVWAVALERFARIRNPQTVKSAVCAASRELFRLADSINGLKTTGRAGSTFGG
jgi:hypothetical protein